MLSRASKPSFTELCCNITQDCIIEPALWLRLTFPSECSSSAKFHDRLISNFHQSKYVCHLGITRSIMTHVCYKYIHHSHAKINWHKEYFGIACIFGNQLSVIASIHAHSMSTLCKCNKIRSRYFWHLGVGYLYHRWHESTNDSYLTHWGRDTMAAIFKCIFLNENI